MRVRIRRFRKDDVIDDGARRERPSDAKNAFGSA